MKVAKLIITGTVLASGCSAPSPERVCGQFMGLSVREDVNVFMARHPSTNKKEFEESKKELDQAVFRSVTRGDRLRKACVARLQEISQRDPREYAAQARCAMKAVDLQAFSGCIPLWQPEDPRAQ